MQGVGGWRIARKCSSTKYLCTLKSSESWNTAPMVTNNIRAFSVSSKLGADVNIKIENGIRTLQINRPSKRNALTSQMYLEMTKSLNESNDDPQTKIVVITGTGEFYTAGNDIASLFEDFKAQVPINEFGFAKFTRGLIDCRKPIVGMVNGHAIGIGVTMLPHFETVFASDKATFNTPFIKLGIPPECCSSYLLPKVMGHAKAGEMLHFNATLNAQEAYTSNLVTRVFPAAEFEAKSWERINEMAQYPLESLLRSKELIRGAERAHLHKVEKEEGKSVNVEIVGKAVMKFLSKQKK